MDKNKEIVLGIDPSSTSIGIAKYEKNKIGYFDIWTKKKEKSLSENLIDYYNFLESLFPVSVVVIEDLSVPLNLDTVKKISYYQGLSIFVAQKWNCKIELMRPTTARKKAHGKGNLNKQQVYDLVAKNYPLRDFKKGGADQADAITLVEAYVGDK